MSKITLATVDSGFLSQTATNNNFELLEAELQNKVLYRNNPTGEPNSMQQDLDMNGHRILNQLAEGGDGFIWKRSWGAGLVYEVNNIVYVPSGLYEGYAMICVSNHTSSALFQTDYDLDRWEILASRGASGAGTGDLISTNNLSDIASPSAALTNLNGMPKSGGTFTGVVLVPNEDYDAGTWETNFEVPTKGAIRELIENLDFTPTLANISNDPTLASDSGAVAASTEWVNDKALVNQSAVTVLNGLTSATINIPAGVKTFTLVGENISLSNTEQPRIQLGTSSGPVTTGYTGGLVGLGVNTVDLAVLSANFPLRVSSTAGHTTCAVTFYNIAGTNKWVTSYNNTDSSGRSYLVSGFVNLPSSLTTVILTRSGGAATFDNGSLMAVWQY